jgi:ATP-binding cassette subfamily F protein 3
VVPHETIGFVRGICGAFLFSGDDVDKSIGVLSGGERARVSLAKILVKPGNLMVMDEPTNHLDIISSEILIDALADFNGTLLFVSHNQSFVNRLATKIWDIRDESIIEYPGKLDEYYDHLYRIGESASYQNQEEMRISEYQNRELAGDKPYSRKMLRREKAERRRLINARLNPIRDKLAKLEERIDHLEGRKKELEKILADPDIFRDKDKGLPLLNEYAEVKDKIEGLIGRWEYQHEELKSTKKELGLLEDME